MKLFFTLSLLLSSSHMYSMETTSPALSGDNSPETVAIMRLMQRCAAKCNSEDTATQCTQTCKQEVEARLHYFLLRRQNSTCGVEPSTHTNNVAEFAEQAPLARTFWQHIALYNCQNSKNVDSSEKSSITKFTHDAEFNPRSGLPNAVVTALDLHDKVLRRQ